MWGLFLPCIWYLYLYSYVKYLLSNSQFTFQIDIDFNVLQPTCFNVLGNYEVKLLKIFNVLITKVKDMNSRKLLESLIEMENPCESNS